MQSSSFYMTTAACHPSRGCFCGWPKCENWCQFLGPTPFYTQKMRSQWVIRLVRTLTIADWFPLWGKTLLTARRMTCQGQWREMLSHASYMVPRTLQGALFLISHDWECMLPSGKSLPDFSSKHGMASQTLVNWQRVRQGAKWSRRKGSQLWVWRNHRLALTQTPAQEEAAWIPPIRHAQPESVPLHALHFGEGAGRAALSHTWRTW